MSFRPYIQYAIMLLPLFSAMTCLLLTLFSWPDSITRKDRRLKLAVAGYFVATAGVWSLMFFYVRFPLIFIPLNVLLLAAYVLVPIFLYRTVVIFTLEGTPSRQGLWHYAAPATLCGAMLVWWLATPPEITRQIVMSRAVTVPAGYEAYHLFFTSKPFWRFLFGILYFGLTVRILWRYYKSATQPGSLVRRPAPWVIFLMTLIVIMLVAGVVTAAIPRASVQQSLRTAVAALAVVGQHVLLIYHIICRKYLLYAVATTKREEPTQGKRREHRGAPLTRKAFEEYFRAERPWLDSNFKITALVEVFDLNRNTIGAFVNHTYGVNFNRYLNRRRIDELHRLLSLPENYGRRRAQLAVQAGFTDGKHYLRAVRAEQEEQPAKPTKKRAVKKKGGRDE